jgi:hypothetical protein
MATCVPRASNIVSAWIHKLSLLEEGGLVDLMLIDLFFTPIPAMFLHAL